MNDKALLNVMELTSIRRLLTRYRCHILERMDWPEDSIEYTTNKLILKDIDEMVSRIQEAQAAYRFGEEDILK